MCRMLLSAGLIVALMDVVAAQGTPWRDASEYLPLFTAERGHRGAYRVYVSPWDVDTVLRQLAGQAGLLHPPGSWQPRLELPLDAFGQEGSYDRSRLARLYGARRVHTARGPVRPTESGLESWTILGPYPDADLRRLEPGTMLLVLRLR